MPTPGDGGGEERSLRLGTFLEVTGGAEARDGVRGSARDVNDEHTGGRTAVSDEQQLDQVVVLLAAGPHLGARVGPKLRGCRTAKFDPLVRFHLSWFRISRILPVDTLKSNYFLG